MKTVYGSSSARRFPGVSQGKTKEEAVVNLEEAIKSCLEVRAE
jgi:predicted RNase H-like HicB family nuclease